ncbi:MAG: hypothetical protein JO293_08585 [Candidatus Eremiobacteraeota bacterium]|nr:hypothetical protein [Candidatus Eremiobacteraeota bacterium]
MNRLATLALVAVVAIVALLALHTSQSLAALAARYSHGDVVEFGSDVTIPADQEVNGDVVDFGGNVDVHGKVDGSVVVFGGDLHIFPEGSVAKDTVSFGGSIKNESTSMPHKQNAATPPVETPGPMPTEEPMPTMPAPLPYERPMHELAKRAEVLVPDALLTLLAFFLFPMRTRNVEENLEAQPLLAIFLGVLAPFFLAFALVVLAVLVVTIPLIPVAVIAFVIAYLIGKAAIASFLGRRLLEVAKVAEPQPLAVIAVGLAVILVFTGATPIWFGLLMYFTIAALATGAALVSFMRTRPGLLGAQPAPQAATSLPTFTPPAGPTASGPPAIPQ